ncbi:tyrosine--tRNA ligase [Candidatus Kaiserbacteria bacterium]|nr:tyrosine--tRNA ligase [Candidatus Kaiserbacteria bacterium]
MTISEELEKRGLVEHSSADVEKIFSEKRTVYIGSDPTADSLHVGHLAWITLLKRLSDAGHTPILLVGGGTGMIGDPKEKGERSLLSEKVVDKNAKKLRKQLSGLLKTTGRLRMVNNADWLRKVKLIPFLRDVGKHFTVNDLVKRDLIKKRLETPDESISYTEFTYSLLQAYDFWQLHQKYKCDLQIGASDQWTNMLSGVDLIRKQEGKEVFALAIPLITDASGRKFGKSEGNAVWLDAEKTSPYEFYQFWLGVEDEKVIDYLNIYTFLSLEEIESIEKEHQANPGARTAQKKLAHEITTFVHGLDNVEKAKNVSHILFEGGDIQSLSKDEKNMLIDGAPSYRLEKNMTLLELVTATELASSNREGRTFIEEGAVSIDGEKKMDATEEVSLSSGELKQLQRGKKQKVIVYR